MGPVYILLSRIGDRLVRFFLILGTGCGDQRFPFGMFADIAADKRTYGHDSEMLPIDVLQNVADQRRPDPLPSECFRNPCVGEVDRSVFGRQVLDLGDVGADSIFVSLFFGVMQQNRGFHGGKRFGKWFGGSEREMVRIRSDAFVLV